MLGDSININNFCCNPVVLEKKKNPVGIAFLGGPICTTKGSAWAMPKMKNNFFFLFFRNNKSRSSAFRNFNLTKYHMFWLSSESFSTMCDIFFIKKAHVQLKQLWSSVPVLVSGLSMNILHTGNKSPMQRHFLKNSAGDLLPTLRFLGRLYNFCFSAIIFSLIKVTMIYRRAT